MLPDPRRVPVSPSRPLRVVVVGSSVGYFVRPPGEDRTDGPYPEQAAALLADADVPVTLTNRSRWFLQIDDAFDQVEADVFAVAPDVVVLNFGWVECQPKLFPTPVLEWLTTYRPNLNPKTFRARRAVVRRGAQVYKQLTPWAAARVQLPSRMGLGQFEAELDRYICTIRREQRSLVIALNVNPPTDRIEDVLPGAGERSERFSSLIRQVVESFDDPQVQLLDVRSLVLDKGSEAVLPDGIHFNSEGHHLVATALADRIVSWLERT